MIKKLSGDLIRLGKTGANPNHNGYKMDSLKSGFSTSTLGGKKFKIQQSIAGGSTKKGPHAIVRTADLNDGIAITRRFGEGSKPLFSRDDITVNQSSIDRRDTTSSYDHSFGCKSKTTRRSFSTESSSPERYRQRENKKHSSPTLNRHKSPGKSTYIEKPNHNREKPESRSKFSSTKTDRYRRRDNTKSRSPSPAKKKPVEKLPYYRDEQREKDRLKRLYGNSRSRSPPPHSGRGSPIRKRRFQGTSRRRSESRERHRRYSPHRSSRREYGSHRSKTRSRTRSPQRRERRKNVPKEVNKGQKEDSNSFANAVISATPQYIPIPVPVPADYAAYSFPGWTPPQPPWHNSPHRPPPPSHFAPFPMWPMIPPMRPSHQTPYIGMPPSLPYAPMTAQFRPLASQRHPPPRYNSINYQSRPKKT